MRPLVAAARAAIPAVTLSAASPRPVSEQRQRFKVGVVDFEYDEDDDENNVGASSASNVSVNHHRHLTGSIFYPSSATASTSARAPRWSPSFYYTHSYVSFASRFNPDFDKPLVKAKTALLAVASHGLLYAAGVRVAADAGWAAEPLKKSAENDDGDTDDGEPCAPFPAVVFSHGLGGTRAAYSTFASALASEGFCVIAIEHADGTASAARLAGNRGWRDYERWQSGGGGGGTSQTERRGEARRAELAAAARVMKALGGGGRIVGLSLENGRLPLDFFVGSIDSGVAPAVVGHSFGGALAADAAANASDVFCAGVALDSWWGACPPESPAIDEEKVPQRRRAPLLILGSDAWNTPNLTTGEIACGGEAQEKVLRSFASSSSKSNHGALFAVLKGSSHAGFSDVVSLLPGISKWFYGRRRKKMQQAAGAAGVTAGQEEEQLSSSIVTEATDPCSTAKASAAMTAAFLRKRTAKGARDSFVTVDDEDRRNVEEASSGIGVALRGVRVV